MKRCFACPVYKKSPSGNPDRERQERGSNMKQWKKSMICALLAFCIFGLAGCRTSDRRTETEADDQTESVALTEESEGALEEMGEGVMDGAEDMMDGAGQAVDDMMDGAGHAVDDVMDGVENGVDDIGDDMDQNTGGENNGNARETTGR
jgi:hypothetical protein